MNHTGTNKCNLPDAMLLASVFLIGIFHEYLSCALSAVLCIYLLIRLGKGKQLRIRKSIWALAVPAVCLCYGLSVFWAVDSGMAFIGFLKFLPVALYQLCLWQEEPEKSVLNWLPYAAAIATVISAIGMQLPVLERYFSVADRLAGFFQYPNTYAIFTLVCQLLLLKKPDKKLWDYGVLVILLGGILYSGSRTVFVVAIAANAAMLLAATGKKLRLVLALTGGVAVVVILLLASNENSVLHRYLSISLTQSTFVGRLLYFVDALKLLIRYPFGMGYMGYYYAQGAIQSGVYSVAYIHNDFYQFFLDAGWIPGCLMLAAVGSWLLNKRIPISDKIIVGALCLHSMFDFNLQFIGVFMLLVRLTDNADAPQVELKKCAAVKAVAAITAAVSVYMAIPLAAAHWEARELSELLYPFNTQNKVAILEKTEDIQSANALADEILKQNQHYYVPYSIKAKYSYSTGNFTALIDYKKQAFEKQPFAHTEYEEYCQMLINGISLYQKAGDFRSVEVCKTELKATKLLLEANAQRLSSLGKMIQDQPVTQLSQQILDYIGALE